MTLQGLIWNCRGLRKKGVSTYLKSLIQQYSFHFVGLQETMVKHCEEKLLKNFDYQQEYLWLYNSAKGKSGGILVGIKKDLYDAGSFQQGEFMLQINLWDKVNRIIWNLLVVYGAAHEDQKIKFLTELSSFCSKSKEPLLIGCDFNLIRYSFERNKPGGVQRL